MCITRTGGYEVTPLDAPLDMQPDLELVVFGGRESPD